MKKASEIVEELVPKKQTQKWKYEGDWLTIEDGEFDYDISALSVGEEQSGEQGIQLHVRHGKPTKEGNFGYKTELSNSQLIRERNNVFSKEENK